MGCRKFKMEKLSPESEVHPARQRGSVVPGSRVNELLRRGRIPLAPLPTLRSVGFGERSEGMNAPVSP